MAKLESGTMNDTENTWGMYENMAHALEMIRKSKGNRDGYALIADATDVR